MRVLSIKVLSASLVGWLLICFSISGYLYFNQPMFGPSNLERTSYGASGGRLVGDRVDLTVDEVREGDFFGDITLTISSEEAREGYKISERQNIVVGGVHAANWVLQAPNWIDLEKSEIINGHPVFKSKNKEKIHSRGDDFWYPFDTHYIGLSFKIHMYYGEGYERFEKVPESGTVLFDLPRGYIVRSLDKIPDSSCSYRDCEDQYLADVNDDELLHIVERSGYLKWFVLGAAAVVLAPLVLSLRTGLNNLNVDIIASLASIYGVRALLIGNTTKFYALDFLFAGAAFLMVVIPMVKILISKDG